MQTYVYKIQLIKRLWDEKHWTKEDEMIIERHFERIKKDVELGKIIHVGKTMIENENGYGLVVFECEDEEKALQYMNEDPAIKEGIMTGTCLAYKIVFQK